MANTERPLSPHVFHYRWTITMASSIIHRVSGVGLTLGLLLLTWWLVALAAGPDAYAAISGFLGHWFGRLVLFVITWAGAFHLANGIRHLFWDIGEGFELRTATVSGWFVAVVSVVVTLALWFFAYQTLGVL